MRLALVARARDQLEELSASFLSPLFDPAKTFILNKSNFALPYLALFNVFRRLM
jgi:hypothetical protein